MAIRDKHQVSVARGNHIPFAGQMRAFSLVERCASRLSNDQTHSNTPVFRTVFSLPVDSILRSFNGEAGEAQAEAVVSTEVVLLAQGSSDWKKGRVHCKSLCVCSGRPARHNSRLAWAAFLPQHLPKSQHRPPPSLLFLPCPTPVQPPSNPPTFCRRCQPPSARNHGAFNLCGRILPWPPPLVFSGRPVTSGARQGGAKPL